MSFLCCNCRGMGNPRSVWALRHWGATLSPNIVFLSETMISREHAESLRWKLGFSNAFGVDSVGNSGGLCLFWKNESIDFSLVSFSKNHICGDVVKEGAAPWRFVGIYGCPDSSNKYRTWELIRKLCEESDKPILLGGDYNEILAYEEKEGGAESERRDMGCFREVVDECGIRDLGYKGQWFTWGERKYS